VDRNADGPVGLTILYEDSSAHNTQRHLRIGYVIKESRWGEGVASELVSGLADWARSQPLVASIIGGVESQNAASARVLTKNGFSLTNRGPAGNTDTYTLELRR
jgi:RimJ/RimL family protein N-acetyltransferase